MENLSKFQQKLIKDLISEFSKISPKQKNVNGTERFSIATIDDCINEEDRLKKSMGKHNAMMKTTFVGQLESDMKEFGEEFGSVLDTQEGRHIMTQEGNRKMYSTIEDLKQGNGMTLYIVSKTKTLSQDSNDKGRLMACKGKQFLDIKVELKTEVVTTTLKSGQDICLRRIIGLNFYKDGYSSRDNQKFSSLDNLIQGDSRVQQELVKLSA